MYNSHQMSELYTGYNPDVEINGQRIIRPSDLTGIEIDSASLGEIRALMTPKKLLEQTEFEAPYQITPDIFPSFGRLLARREYIKNLKLLPIKTAEDRSSYHTIPQESLEQSVADFLAQEDIALGPNRYPYSLPPDLNQLIVWIKDSMVEEERIIEFLAKAKMALKVEPNKLILFERPKKTQSPMVKGTLPQYRHIHFWIPS